MLPNEELVDSEDGDGEPAHGDGEPAHGDEEPAHGDEEPAHGDEEPFHGDCGEIPQESAPIEKICQPLLLTFLTNVQSFHLFHLLGGLGSKLLSTTLIKIFDLHISNVITKPFVCMPAICMHVWTG